MFFSYPSSSWNFYFVHTSLSPFLPSNLIPVSCFVKYLGTTGLVGSVK